MADDMSGAEPRATQHFGDIVVVGGGCYGSYYVRQLHRARAAAAVSWRRLLVVDIDPDCPVACGSAEVTFVCRDWSLFFNEYLGEAARRGTAAVAADAIVPSPLMPHLMSQWVVSRARARWPGRDLKLTSLAGALEGALDVPWQRSGEDGTHYVSFATWLCPINCIEPATCPHTRGPRAWSLPPTVRAFVETERLRGRRIDGPAILHCAHRAYGVGMFGVDEVLAADALVARVAARRGAEVLVGTVSHCHGALAVLQLGERADEPFRSELPQPAQLHDQ